MNQVRPPAQQLASIKPYAPNYIPAEVMLSANENPFDIPTAIRSEIETAIRNISFNRYPDPLANDLRSIIAQSNGLEIDQVMIGNGGDELLFNLALAWGGLGRTFLNFSPTFSIYKNNAQLTQTAIIDIPRRDDFTLNENTIIARLEKGDIDYTIVANPNNPSGNTVSNSFIERMCESSDALVLVDEAYFEFSCSTALSLLNRFENLVILRTFSKAFALAGVRIGYLLGSNRVLKEFTKVRQPYSVDAVSQEIARVTYENRTQFEHGIHQLIKERDRMMKGLDALEGIKVFPSESNFILFRISKELNTNASTVWKRLLNRGILIRDFSHSFGLERCLRVSVGSAQENDCFLRELKDILARK